MYLNLLQAKIMEYRSNEIVSNSFWLLSQNYFDKLENTLKIAIQIYFFSLKKSRATSFLLTFPIAFLGISSNILIVDGI